MSENCKRCGLPLAICVCETIAKESQRINLYVEKRKFGKVITIVEGLDAKSIDLKEVARKLKSVLACGGTIKGDKIELQGDHKARAKQVLIQLGFSEDTIKAN